MAGVEVTPNTIVQVRPERLRTLIAGLFEAAGAPAEDAAAVAEVLVEADLRGVESHGSTRVAGYLAMIRRGMLNPRPNVQVLKETPSMAMIEGDRAFGIVVAKRAMRMAMDKARNTTIACVTVRNVTHTGMIGFYPMMAARAGLIGLTMNNGPAILPPFGGRTPTYATNPYAAAFPAGDEDPVVLDMATSIVAGGKLRLAAKKGGAIPREWALDRHGVPTTDPQEALLHGFIQWTGGYKGFGMATVVELLSGVLSGGLFGTDVPPMKQFGQEPLITSAFYMALDPSHFMPLAEFEARTRRLKAMIKASERAQGVEEIFVPGEPEFRKKAERLQSGIPLSGVVYAELREHAEAAGVPFELG